MMIAGRSMPANSAPFLVAYFDCARHDIGNT